MLLEKGFKSLFYICNLPEAWLKQLPALLLYSSLLLLSEVLCCVRFSVGHPGRLKDWMVIICVFNACWKFFFFKSNKNITHLLKKIQYTREKKKGIKLTFAKSILYAKLSGTVYFNIKSYLLHNSSDCSVCFLVRRRKNDLFIICVLREINFKFTHYYWNMELATMTLQILL